MTGSMETNTTEETNTNEDFYITMPNIIYVSYMVVLSVVSLLGITGNGLVIWFVAFKMKKTVNSVWFSSLAFADFTFCLLMALYVIYVVLGSHWPFRTFICKLGLFATFLNMSASVLQLTVINIDRCISVVFPVWCQNHRTVRLAMKVALAVWIVSILLNISYLINTHADDSDEYFVACYKEWLMQRAQIILRFIVLFVISFPIIIFCYTVIFLRIRRNRRVTSTKPFKVIAAVIISFFICWVPYNVFSLLLSHGSDTWNHKIRLVIIIGQNLSTWLAYSNSCVNPLLYVFIGQDFKEKFWRTIKSGFERAFTEDNNLTDPNRFSPDHAKCDGVV